MILSSKLYQTTDRTFHFNIHPGIRTPWDILVSRVFQIYSIGDNDKAVPPFSAVAAG